MNVETLTQALKEAKAAADLVAGTHDGGTCNFDSPIILLSRALPFAVVQEAAKAAGVSVHDGRWLGDRVAFVHVTQGQGQRRTSMAEAAYDALKKSGVPASMYYQMD